MPIEEALMDEGSWSLRLKPTTSWDVRNNQASASNYMFSTVIATALHHRLGEISDSNLIASAVWAGVYTRQSGEGFEMSGPGLAWWLGGNDNGDMYTGADVASANTNFAVHMAARIAAFGNGMSNGSYNSTTGAMILNFESGQTRRETIDTLVAGFGYEWRLDPTFTLNGDTQANLFDSNQVIFTREGARQQPIPGFAAELTVPEVNGEEYRTNIEVDWNDGTNNGAATNTPPSSWRTPAGTVPVLTALLNGKPKGKIRGNRTVAKIRAWILASQTRANVVATGQANRVNRHEYTVNAEFDLFAPWRFYQVGDTVYVYDLDKGIYDLSATPITYRGQVIYPLSLRVVSQQTPFRKGMGVYLVRYTASGGANRTILDLTDDVLFEEAETVVELSTNLRYHRRNARPRRIRRRQVTRAARRIHRDDLLSQLTFGD